MTAKTRTIYEDKFSVTTSRQQTWFKSACCGTIESHKSLADFRREHP